MAFVDSLVVMQAALGTHVGQAEHAAAVSVVRRSAPAAVTSRNTCYGATGLPIVVNLVAGHRPRVGLRLLLELSWSAWEGFDPCVGLCDVFVDSSVYNLEAAFINSAKSICLVHT